jgi:acyl carrier protein
MISSEEIRSKLCGYPEDLFQQYEAFLKDRDPEHLSRFVIGLLRFLQDASESTEAQPETTALRDDLGVDSITIAEVVFQLEDIFEIEIENQDLMDINTVGDLKAYILKKLA